MGGVDTKLCTHSQRHRGCCWAWPHFLHFSGSINAMLEEAGLEQTRKFVTHLLQKHYHSCRRMPVEKRNCKKGHHSCLRYFLLLWLQRNAMTKATYKASDWGLAYSLGGKSSTIMAGSMAASRHSPGAVAEG